MVLANKVALLTGASGVIGREIALGLAGQGFDLILAVRDQQKGEALQKEVKTRYGDRPVHLELVDLSRLDSLSGFVQRVSANYPKLDVLINNGALVPPKRQLSPNGLELQFAVNILSYFILMFGLSSLLKRSSPSRIINVASNYAGDLDLNDLQFEKRQYDKTVAYKQSKQADRMLSWQAAEWFKGTGVTVNACHPGVTTSPVLKGLDYEEGWDSAAASAKTAVFLASNKEVEGVTGKYWIGGKETPCPWQATKEENAKLWEYCRLKANLSSPEESSANRPQED